MLYVTMFQIYFKDMIQACVDMLQPYMSSFNKGKN